MLIPACKNETTQDIFLAWKDGATLQGQFLSHDSSGLVGPPLAISPSELSNFYPVWGSSDTFRRYAVASLPEHDLVLAAWIGRVPGYAEGVNDITLVSRRLIGRLGSLGEVRTRFWYDGWEPVPAVAGSCRAPAWGFRHFVVDVASGTDHFLMVWIAEEDSVIQI
jgi:hypothetical protein